MANLAPIQVGTSDRIVRLLNNSNSSFVFKDKTRSASTISQSRGGPLINFLINGETNNKSIQSNFNSQSRTLYKKISPHADYGTGLFSFGPKEPYITKEPGKTDLRRFDSRTFPIGSTVDDTVRIAKWSISGKGLLFYGKQFLLQSNAAYNETGIYNPLSVLQSTIRPASFGLIPRPKRHIDVGGGLLAGLLSSIGIKDNSSEPPTGTAGALDRSTLPPSQEGSGKGNIRPKTGFEARQKALLKLGYPSSSGKGGFLGNLVKRIFPALGSQPDQFKDVKGDKKYRADQDLYYSYIAYHRENVNRYPLLYGNTPLIHLYSPELKYIDAVKRRKDNINSQTATFNADVENAITREYSTDAKSREILDGTLLMSRYLSLYNEELSTSIYSPNDKLFFYNQLGDSRVTSIRTNLERYELTTTRLRNRGGIEFDYRKSKSPMSLKYSDLVKKRETYRDIDLSVERDLKKVKLPISGESDYLNENSVIDGNSFEVGSDYKQSDIINFWFKDVVNNKYIQFRSTVTGIGDQQSVDWEEIKYLGKPDSIYNYKGYTRTLNFSFTVYVNSIKELYPTWRKINYLNSFSRPSKYSSGRFMVPPLIELRLGDMYYDLPIVITGINLNVPDDAVWETLPYETNKNNKDYLYGLDDIIKIPNVKWGQYPTRVNITVSANVLEKEQAPAIGTSIFGPAQYQDSSPENFVLRDTQYELNSDGKIITSNFDFSRRSRVAAPSVVRSGNSFGQIQTPNSFNRDFSGDINNQQPTFNTSPFSGTQV